MSFVCRKVGEITKVWMNEMKGASSTFCDWWVLLNLGATLTRFNEVKCALVKDFGQLNINSCIKQVNLG